MLDLLSYSKMGINNKTNTEIKEVDGDKTSRLSDANSSIKV
jgi:hypothetical protein